MEPEEFLTTVAEATGHIRITVSGSASRSRFTRLLRRLVAESETRGSTRLLVDTSPDMREQLIDARISALDAVLITHDHADQLHGLDDLRMIAMNLPGTEAVRGR